jgi:hypothetical protein
MKLALLASCALALAAPAAAQSLKDGAVVADQIEAVVTVTAIDAQKRTVTFRGPKGGVATLDVPPEAQNLDKVKKGDRFKLKYVEAVAVGIRQGGAPADAETKEVKLAPKGASPGGIVVQTQTRSVMVDAVDYTSRYVAVRGTSGQTLALKVADGVPLEQLSAGDRISVTYTRALALAMEPQPAKAPAKKPAKK